MCTAVRLCFPMKLGCLAERYHPVQAAHQQLDTSSMGGAIPQLAQAGRCKGARPAEAAVGVQMAGVEDLVAARAMLENEGAVYEDSMVRPLPHRPTWPTCSCLYLLPTLPTPTQGSLGHGYLPGLSLSHRYCCPECTQHCTQMVQLPAMHHRGGRSMKMQLAKDAAVRMAVFSLQGRPQSRYLRPAYPILPARHGC